MVLFFIPSAIKMTSSYVLASTHVLVPQLTLQLVCNKGNHCVVKTTTLFLQYTFWILNEIYLPMQLSLEVLQ